MATRVAFAALTALAAFGVAPCRAQDVPNAMAAQPPTEAGSIHGLALGAAVGSPGYANATVSYALPRVALRVAAGIGGSGRWGLQGDVVLPLVRAAQLSGGIAVVGGLFSTRAVSADGSPGNGELRQQPYLGAALDLVLAGFHLQAGLAHGFHDYPPNQQLLAQFGYEWRIR